MDFESSPFKGTVYSTIGDTIWQYETAGYKISFLNRSIYDLDRHRKELFNVSSEFSMVVLISVQRFWQFPIQVFSTY